MVNWCCALKSTVSDVEVVGGWKEEVVGGWKEEVVGGWKEEDCGRMEGGGL